MVRNLPVSAGAAVDVGSISELGRSPGEATYSSILAGEVLWTEQPGGLESMQLQRVGYD